VLQEKKEKKDTCVILFNPNDIYITYINNGEEVIWSAEEEEEEGEGRGCRTGESGGGAFKAWTDEDMDGVGVASQGCVCLACLVEIE